MYIDDHNNYLPCSNGGNSWDDKLGVMDYDGRGLPESAYNVINAGNPKLYQCPATKHELNRSNTRYLRSYAMNWGKSHGPNRWRGVISNWQDGWSMKINEINDPGNSIMLMEYHKSDNDLSTGNNSVANNMANINSINDNLRWPHEFHKSNYALVDGSVRFISLQSTYYGLRDATSNDNQLNTMWDCQD